MARIKVGDRVRRKTDQYSGPWGGRLGLVTGTYNHVGADVVVCFDDDNFRMAMSSRDLELYLSGNESGSTEGEKE